jgi:hypothetical protein
MSSTVALADLTTMHPRLLWDEISAAAVAVLGSTDKQAPYPVELAVQDIPGFGNGTLALAIEPAGVSPARVARIRRTYEAPRLVELAAIAIAGLGLYHAGGHEIRDVALRWSGADYLIGEAKHLLEVAGRSRREDFKKAWDQRWQRLSQRNGVYVCVVEFETFAGRLGFREE